MRAIQGSVLGTLGPSHSLPQSLHPKRKPFRDCFEELQCVGFSNYVSLRFRFIWGGKYIYIYTHISTHVSVQKASLNRQNMQDVGVLANLESFCAGSCEQLHVFLAQLSFF